MPSAGLEPATPALGRRRSGPLSYEGMLPAARLAEVIIDIRRSGRSSARLECTVRDREVGGSNPLAPTSVSSSQRYGFDDAIQPPIWVRELNPSLFRMLRTWLSTVRSDMNSLAPICLLLSPSAT